jgi:4-hydroxybenzoate polyprenyltransferase
MAKLQRRKGGRPTGEDERSDEAAVEVPQAEPEAPEDDDSPPEDTPEDTPEDAPEDAPGDTLGEASDGTAYRDHAGGVGFSLRDSSPVLLLQAAHPKQGLVTALAVFGVAVLTGRPAREAGVVLATVLVGQAILGWHNDLVDRRRDQAHHAPGKPVADGRLSTGNTWFTMIIAVLVLVPLSITTGITAGMIYLGSVAVGMLGNVLFRTTWLSFWSWAVSFALLPAYLSYGGWGGQAEGLPPEPVIVALAAALGVGVHLLRSVWGLVADHEDGWSTLPLKLGLKLGATRLLVLSSVYLAAVVVVLVIEGARVGLSQ